MTEDCVVESVFCSRLIDILLMPFKPWERFLPLMLLVLPIIFCLLVAAKFHVYTVYMWFSYSYKLYTNSRITHLIQHNGNTRWGYTGYELFIWFSALWILVLCYLCLYWYQIPQVIFLDLKCASTHHKRSLHPVFWPETNGWEYWPGRDSKVRFSQSAKGTFPLTQPLRVIDSSLI